MKAPKQPAIKIKEPKIPYVGLCMWILSVTGGGLTGWQVSKEIRKRWGLHLRRGVAASCRSTLFRLWRDGYLFRTTNKEGKYIYYLPEHAPGA